MSVIPLTVFCSLLLVACFIALFIREQRRRKFASAERDSLLPLADETPRAVEDAPDAACGCRRGLRPPCSGCQSRATAPVPSGGIDDELYF